jgi:hypothetical protein
MQNQLKSSALLATGRDHKAMANTNSDAMNAPKAFIASMDARISIAADLLSLSSWSIYSMRDCPL